MMTAVSLTMSSKVFTIEALSVSCIVNSFVRLIERTLKQRLRHVLARSNSTFSLSLHR